MEELLKLIDVRKHYISQGRTIEALKGISLTLYKGEIVALLGVNGAGKTTVSGILATLHPLTGGAILYQGRSLYEQMMTYRRALGYCPQRPNLDLQLTVEQNLYFAGRYFLLSEQEIATRIAYLCGLLRLNPYRNALIEELSGGYKQRVALARALMHEPTFLILDEPTIALDPHVRRQLWDIIKELKAHGVTILLTTHYLDEAEYLADRVCILDKGLVKLIDTPENLKAAYEKGTLEDVFLQLMNTEMQDPASL